MDVIQTPLLWAWLVGSRIFWPAYQPDKMTPGPKEEGKKDDVRSTFASLISILYNPAKTPNKYGKNEGSNDDLYGSARYCVFQMRLEIQNYTGIAKERNEKGS